MLGITPSVLLQVLSGSATAITMATSSEWAAGAVARAGTVLFCRKGKVFCWYWGTRCWEASGRWGVSPTKGVGIDTSGDAPSIGIVRSWRVDLSPLLKSGWSWEAVTCMTSWKTVLWGGAIGGTRRLPAHPRFPASPPSCSLLLLELALPSEVPLGLLSGECRLRQPCPNLLFVVLRLLVMTSLLYVPRFKHLQPNIFLNNQSYISIYGCKTSLEILKTAFMFGYLSKPNRDVFLPASLCRAWTGRVKHSFLDYFISPWLLCQIIHREGALLDALVALMTHPPVLICFSFREKLVSWILERFWRFGKQP